uniref:TBC1 domain family, member 10C n=1 Tax=Cyprinus carpio TaxID=7962 RepID=A0A8C1RUI9_CYPCA
MSVQSDHSKDEEGNHGPEVTVLETNRFGFILGNGETDSDGPCPELVRHRESKWLNLMTQWEQVMEKKSNKVKGHCQKGIPASVRAKGWPLLCGAKDRKVKGQDLYKRLVKAPDHQGWTDIIKRDTDRQFPFHEMFQSKDGHGQKDLLEVLKAYTQYRPDEGYCQAQGPVAAVLLMNMPAEEAFWCLVQISELYLPGYYSPLLEGVLFDAAVLSSILKKQCPAAHKHLQNQGVEPLMFATDWLMCLYSRHLPFDTLLRVWDLFFCCGVRVLFQVAVVLVRRCLGEGRLRKECDGQMETLERLRGVKQRVQHEQADAFIHEVCSVSLSWADLQKHTEKELEKWKKERPNSTFDPRGRCHGYRMAWERAQDKPKEHEKKERPKGSLTLPLMRSHSSLSPSVLRKKWRKRSSKTDTEEWDGGGRKFSQSVMEESDEEEVRRRSVCGIVGEQRAKRDRLADELCSHKDHITHPSISVVVSSTTDCDVFETEHTETSLKDNSETTRGEEKDRTAACEVEESIQTHHHIQDTNQDVQRTEMQGHQVEQNIGKDKTQDDQNTEAATNQKGKQTGQDEQTVETERSLEACGESTSQEEDTQTDSSKQEEEIRIEYCKQEKETKEDVLPNIIVTEVNEENIPEKEVQIHDVQEEERPQTSRDQHEEHEHLERPKDSLFIHTAIEEVEETQLVCENCTDADKEEGIQQGSDVLPGETKEISDPLKMYEEKVDKRLEDDRQDISLEESDNHSHSAGTETLQPSEAALTFLKTEQESETEHLDRSADPLQQSQSGHQEHNDMDAPVPSKELEHCPADTTVDDAVGSGNPEQSEVDSADGTIILEPQEEDATVASTHSVGTCGNKEISEFNPKNSEVNESPEPENIACCEANSDESRKLTNNVEDDICRSVYAESNQIHSAPGSGNPDRNTVDITAQSGKLESYGMEIAAGSGNSESNNVPVTSESGNNVPVTSASGNPESNNVHITAESGNPESNNVPVTSESGNNLPVTSESGNPESNDVPVTSESVKPESNNVPITSESGNPESNNVPVTSESVNPESNNVPVTSASGNPGSNNVPITSISGIQEDSAVGNLENNDVHVTTESGNPECKMTDVTTETEKTESDGMEVAVESDNSESNIVGSPVENPECNDVQVTTGSGNTDGNIVDSAVGSSNPDHKEVQVTTKSDNSETNREHVTTGSSNPEHNDVPPTSESGNPENNKKIEKNKTKIGSGNPDYKDDHVTTGSDNSGTSRESLSSVPSSKSPNVPPAHLCLRRTSSSRVSYPTILSEDTFKEPQQQELTHSEQTTDTPTQDTHAQPNSQTKADPPKRLGLFRRLRGETNKAPVPKILIQDFSDKEEGLTAKERRRRKREKERKEREEKDRKKQEKEMEKDKEKERKKPQTRGRSFQVLSRKGADNFVSPGDSNSQTSHARRNSAPFSDSYF